MSALHVLERTERGYRCAIHKPVPAGGNAAGVSWATVLVNSGLAKTVLIEGDGPGQITAAEKAQIESGAVVEAVLDIPLGSGGMTLAQVAAIVQDEWSAWASRFQSRYARWGQEIG